MKKPRSIAGRSILPFLFALLVIFTGCSSSHHAAKGKHAYTAAWQNLTAGLYALVSIPCKGIHSPACLEPAPGPVFEC